MESLISWFQAKTRVVKIILGAVLVGCIYFAYHLFSPAAATTSYVTAAVEKGTLTVAVSGSGQVSSSQQIEIKPQVSGDVLKVVARVGDELKAGSPILQLDARDAAKAVRDAKLSYDSAELSLEKLKRATDTSTLLQAKSALLSAQNTLATLKLSQPTDYTNTQVAKQTNADSLAKSYEDAYSAISNSFLDFPTVITGTHDLLYGTGLSDSEHSLTQGISNQAALINSLVSQTQSQNLQSYVDKAVLDYLQAQKDYDQNFNDYKNSTRYISHAAIDKLLDQTIAASKSIAQAAKSESDLYNVWVGYRQAGNYVVFAKVTTYQMNLATYITQINSHLSAMLTVQTTLKNADQGMLAADTNLKVMDLKQPLDLQVAEQNVKQKQADLDKLEAGADVLDLKMQELSVQQRLNALIDAQEKYADATVKAPFEGIIAKLDVKSYDTVSAGSAVATLITKQKIAEITLNEVDVAKVKLGQKATLSFDAIDGLSLTGSVVEVDGLGTVTQGVVSYTVKIGFDAQDDRVKSGMSVSTNIITDVKSDILLVPSAAVKSSGNQYTVQIMDTPTSTNPKIVSVEIGIANDTMTEITTGVKEGDLVVTQTIVQAAATAARPATSIIPGLSGGGGGAARGFSGGGRG